jgi:hypothetical protein
MNLTESTFAAIALCAITVGCAPHTPQPVSPSLPSSPPEVPTPPSSSPNAPNTNPSVPPASPMRPSPGPEPKS